MSYHATIHDLATGRFLLRCEVEAPDLQKAENAAIIKAALAMDRHPGDMDVRHLHEHAERVFALISDRRPHVCGGGGVPCHNADAAG